LLHHWPKLTLFLQQPGAPLDNNIAEKTLKKAILNRKNALFYKTLNGAGVGDLHESDPHLRAERSQSVRLFDRGAGGIRLYLSLTVVLFGESLSFKSWRL